MEASFAVLTPPTPGAIGIVQLTGRDAVHALRSLTGHTDWPRNRLRLCCFDDIDEGLAVRLDDETVQLMPHGGMRVLQRLAERLVELGVTNASERPSPRVVYPEAADEAEALMLDALSRAASPLAIDPLLAQPPLWRDTSSVERIDEATAARLQRLLHPPTVVIAGPPNVGKSTLVNALAGRAVSITRDAPGTTRDYTAAQVELAGLVVQWHDTPGLRSTEDAIESSAIDLAADLISRADLLIAMTDASQNWPELGAARKADIRVASKADLGERDDADVSISTTSGWGIAELVSLIRDTLVPPHDLSMARHTRWLFDARLQEMKIHAAGEDLSRPVRRSTRGSWRN